VKGTRCSTHESCFPTRVTSTMRSACATPCRRQCARGSWRTCFCRPRAHRLWSSHGWRGQSERRSAGSRRSWNWGLVGQLQCTIEDGVCSTLSTVHEAVPAPARRSERELCIAPGDIPYIFVSRVLIVEPRGKSRSHDYPPAHSRPASRLFAVHTR
jgi:hypothetical protein